MNDTAKKDYITNIYLNLHKEQPYDGRYMMPFSTGEYFIYHLNAASKSPYSSSHLIFGMKIPVYLITLPRRFNINLHYHSNKITFKKYTNFAYHDYYDIECPVKLSDYFQTTIYNDEEIPIGLNKVGIENKVKQAIKLAAFL